MQLRVGWVARLGCGVHNCVGDLGERIQKLQGETKCVWGGPRGSPRNWLPTATITGSLKKKKNGRKEVSECPQVSHPPSPGGPTGLGALAQAGDVGTATRGRHDALGGAAGNVVVDLSS